MQPPRAAAITSSDATTEPASKPTASEPAAAVSAAVTSAQPPAVTQPTTTNAATFSAAFTSPSAPAVSPACAPAVSSSILGSWLSCPLRPCGRSPSPWLPRRVLAAPPNRMPRGLCTRPGIRHHLRGGRPRLWLSPRTR